MKRALMLLLLAAGTEAAAQAAKPDVEWVKVVAAARDLAVGETVTLEDIVQRDVPKRLITKSTVKPDSASYIVNQKLNLPMLKGDLMLWSAFEVRNNAGEIDKRCRAIVKEPPTALEQIAGARQRALAKRKR